MWLWPLIQQDMTELEAKELARCLAIVFAVAAILFGIALWLGPDQSKPIESPDSPAVLSD